MQYKKHKDKQLQHLVSMPFIYGAILPITIMDLSLEVYKNVCFRLYVYGIELPERSEYIRIDRHKLSYLKPLEKINCAYCGYANGLAAYFVKICADSESYWCGIQHEKEFEESAKRFYAQEHHKDFLEYGDEEGYRQISKF